jgi:predicted lipid-binding transport protein (Tim44 family)
VTVTRNGEGKIIEGDPSDIHNVENQWVFERDVTSKNPNWKIIET